MIFCSEINSQVTMKIHRSFDLFLNMLSSFGSEPFKLYRVSFAKHLSDKLFFFFTKYNFRFAIYQEREWDTRNFTYISGEFELLSDSTSQTQYCEQLNRKPTTVQLMD